MPLDRCTEGSEIDIRAQYVFAGGQGARRIDANVVRETDGGTFSGGTLIAMAARDFEHPQVVAESKTLLRQVIRYHLDGKPLNTRRILQDLRKL